MLPQQVILQKRRGEELSAEIVKSFISGFTAGTVSDFQMSAFLMATYFRGMSFAETAALTEAFIASGDRLDLSVVPGVKVDKHSTGGIGDKVSMLLVPIVAAAGVPVPMISGRGLDHTGGTLDKLESIPGFTTQLSPEQFIRQLGRVGAAMIGQTERLVPADRRIYAIRDVSSTVDVLPFIAASIISKKVAGGADALVLDVKAGNGGFMTTEAAAAELASLLVRVASHFHLDTAGLLTDMNEPLGCAVGNWLEIVETVDCLRGADVPDLLEVTCALAGIMVHAGKKAASIGEGITIAREMIQSGLAFDKFVEIVAAQGGDVRVIESTLAYPNPSHMIEVHAPAAGYIRSIDARSLGLVSLELGAGRVRSTDAVDSTAGLILRKKRGDAVEAGEPLCILSSSVRSDLFELKVRAEKAFTLAPAPVSIRTKILAYFDGTGVHPWSEISAATKA